MTKLIVRLILSTMLLPLAAVLFIVMILVASQIGAGPDIGIIAAIWIIESLFISIYWYVLWKPLVNWTPARKRGTIMAVLLSIISGLIFSGFIYLATTDMEPAVGMGGIAPPLVFILSTLAVWKESQSERSERLQLQEGQAIECPSCGHDLRGLKATTCPECGMAPTLQELLYSQPGHDSHDVESHEPDAGT